MLWNDTMVESNEYYPYGGLFSAAASAQPYKYGSKELDRTHGLDLYDSEARWYDSLIGRTSTMDPFAEKYYPISPYSWCASNPMRFVDENGKDWVKNETNNEYIWMDGVASINTTPEGYEYIGNNEELLKSLNINPNIHVFNDTKYSFGISGDLLKIAIGTLNKYEAFYSANVEIGQSKVYINGNNVNGLYFKGISFTAVFNQVSISSNADFMTDYKGQFYVVYGDDVYRSIFKNYNEPSIIGIGVNSRKASVFIDSNNIKQNKGFGLAIIQMGETNNEVFKTLPIRITWPIPYKSYLTNKK